MAIPESTQDSALNLSYAKPARLTPRDRELNDWNAYYQMLLAGKLAGYAGEFVVVHDECVIAHGTDPDQLRCDMAKHLGIDGNKLVIPFVDDKECLLAE